MNPALKTQHELLEDFRDAAKNLLETEELRRSYSPELFKMLQAEAQDRLKEVLRKSETYFRRVSDAE